MKNEEYYLKSRLVEEFANLREQKFPERFKKIQKKLNFDFFGDILDLGCGDGIMSKEIKRHYPKCNIYGVDISEDELKIANKYCVEVKNADFSKNIPYEDNRFDIIFCHEVIEHIVDTDLFLEECFRVLKKDGYLILTTPNLLAWYQRILCLFGIIPTFYELSFRNRKIGLGFLNKILKQTNPVGHVRVFNSIGLKDILELYNFNISRFKGLNINYNFPYILKYIFRYIDIFFSFFPSLSSNLLVLAKKDEIKK